MTLVVLYIQIVVFHIEGRHTLQEPGLGAVITKFKGGSAIENRGGHWSSWVCVKLLSFCMAGIVVLVMFHPNLKSLPLDHQFKVCGDEVAPLGCIFAPLCPIDPTLGEAQIIREGAGNKKTQNTDLPTSPEVRVVVDTCVFVVFVFWFGLYIYIVNHD